MSTLHDKIMNLPQGGSFDFYTSRFEQLAYKTGHRDARHAAAELAVKQDALLAQMADALSELDEAYCRAGNSLYPDERRQDRLRLIKARAALADYKESRA